MWDFCNPVPRENAVSYQRDAVDMEERAFHVTMPLDVT